MNKSKSSLFLMEILVSILLFSIASAVCVQVFVKASQLNQSSRELEQSLCIAQNFAEIMRSSNNPAETIAALFPDAKVEPSQITLFYDRDFCRCKESSPEAAYFAQLTFSKQEALQQMKITVNKLGTASEIFTLLVSKNMDETGGNP